jgi:YVTN family beta-propeller protein
MITVSPDGKSLYVTSRDDNKLLVLSAADLSVKAEVATGDEPHGVAYRK